MMVALNGAQLLAVALIPVMILEAGLVKILQQKQGQGHVTREDAQMEIVIQIHGRTPKQNYALQIKYAKLETVLQHAFHTHALLLASNVVVSQMAAVAL